VGFVWLQQAAKLLIISSAWRTGAWSADKNFVVLC
jgi:hypothetical protein